MLRAVALVALLHYAAVGVVPGATLSGEPDAWADDARVLDVAAAAVARRAAAAARWVRVAPPRPTETTWQAAPKRRTSFPARPRWRRVPRLRSDGTGDH